jgi:hypothetical protein
MLSYAFVDAFTRVERQEAIARLRRAVAAAEGVIVDFALFGAEAVRLTVEIAAGAVPRLRAALEASDVHLFARCAAELDRGAAQPTTTRPVLAMLHVAFTTEAACA